MLHSESTVEITKALVKVQAAGMTVKATKTVTVETQKAHFSYDYADLGVMWEACRTALAENNLALTQLPHIVEGGQSLVTLLLHESGEWLRSDIMVAVGDSTDPKALGSMLTYTRRYALAAILGMVVEDEDDDGQAAAPKPQASRGNQGSGRSTPPSSRSQPSSNATPPDFKDKGEVVRFYREQHGLSIGDISYFYPEGTTVQKMTLEGVMEAAEKALAKKGE